METGITIGIDGTGAQAGARTVTRSLDDIAASAGNTINPIKALEEAARLAAGAFTIFKLAEFVQDATRAAAAAESMSVVLKKVAENVGYNSDQIDSLTDSVAKMGMTQESARQTLTKMIQTNIDLSNATKLTTIAQNAAVIAHTSTADALDQMNMAISTGMERTLKHMGIIVDFSKAEKDYAQTLGKSTALMTEKEKTQARVNDVIRASSQINGAFTASLSTAEGIMRQLSVATDETKDEFGKLFLPTYKAILTELLVSMRDVQKWFEDNKSTVTDWSNSLLTGFYAAEAEVVRLAMLLDKAGMALFSFGNAIGNENSMKHYNEYQQRYIENEQRIIELATRANAVGAATPGSGNNVAAAAAGAEATADRDAAAAAALLLDYHNKLVSTSGQSYLAIIKLTGSQLDQAKAEELVYRSSVEYFNLMQMKDDVVVKGILHNNDMVIALKQMKAAYDDLHANDDVKNQLSSLQVATDPYKSQMESIRQRYEGEINWQQELLKSTSLTETQRTQTESRLSLLRKAQAQDEENFKISEYKRGAQSFADSLDTIGNALMTGNKEQFETGKKMAETSNIISTYLSATQSYASLASIPFVGPALGFAAAAAAVTAGMMNQARIESQQYTGMAKGGYIADGAGTPGQDSVPAMLMPGEFVINKDAVQYYGLNNVVDINEFRKRKFKGGGIINTSGWTTDYSSWFNPNNQTQGTQGMTQSQLDNQVDTRSITANGGDATLFNLQLQQSAELQQAQKDGLNTTELVIVQQKEYTNAVKAQQDAIKSALATYTDDLNERMLSAEGESTKETLYKLRVQQAAELATAQKNGYDTTELLKVQTLEYANAVQTAATTISAANQKLIDSSKTALQQAITTQMSILDKMKSILISSASPEDAYAQAQSRFSSASVEDLPDAAQALLDASKAYNASGKAYQDDLKLVLDTLGKAAGAAPTIDKVDQQITLLDQINKAIASGDSALLTALLGTLESTGINIGSAKNDLSIALAAIQTVLNTPILPGENGWTKDQLTVQIGNLQGVLDTGITDPLATKAVRDAMGALQLEFNGTINHETAVKSINMAYSTVQTVLDGSISGDTAAGILDQQSTIIQNALNGLIDGVTASSMLTEQAGFVQVTLANSIKGMFDYTGNIATDALSNYIATLNKGLDDALAATINPAPRTGGLPVNPVSHGPATTPSSTYTPGSGLVTMSSAFVNTMGDVTGGLSLTDYVASLPYRSTQSFHDYLNQSEYTSWYDWQHTIGIYANGGIASGWSMVGERGPELVNFTSPGRVYTAEQTSAAIGGGNNSETIAELREQNRLLRAAIAILQAGFNGTIEAGSKQAESLNVIASKTRLEGAA